MKIAVVGSGLGGLTAAWVLSAHHDVTIYEKQPTLGMDAHSAEVALKDGSSVRVDVPLRVFSEQYYPNLVELYKTVGVEFSSENYSGSFCHADGLESASRAYFTYRNWLVGKLSVPYIGSLRRLLSVTNWRILADLFSFFHSAPQLLNAGKLKGSTFGDFLDAKRYSKEFADEFLIPAVAAICTCSFAAVRAYPADIVVGYLTKRSMHGVRRATGGTSEVVSKLSEACRVWTGRAVQSVQHHPCVPKAPCSSCHQHKTASASAAGSTPDSTSPSPAPTGAGPSCSGAARVSVRDSTGHSEQYDHVIIASQANEALGFLDDPTADQAKALRAFPHESSTVVLHTDAALMPARRRDWRSVNFTLLPGSDKPEVTIWMNAVQPTLGEQLPEGVQLFQTWNPIRTPAQSSVLAASPFERPVVTVASAQQLGLLAKIQGQNSIWFCGSYSLYGMPLLENAVESAIRVAEKLGSRPPWHGQVTNSPVKAATLVARSGFTASGVLLVALALFVGVGLLATLV